MLRSIFLFLLLLFTAPCIAQSNQIIYFENSDIIAQKGALNSNHQKTGKWKYYYQYWFMIDSTDKIEPGLLAQGNYKAGVRDGQWTFYLADGQIHRIENWDNGKAVGLFEFYTTEGEKKESGHLIATAPTLDYADFDWDGIALLDYFDSLQYKKQGKWTIYNIFGQKEEEGQYQNDLKEGFWRIYDYTGFNIRSQGYYKNGLKEGEWWVNSYEVKEKHTYHDDTLLQKIIFSSDSLLRSIWMLDTGSNTWKFVSYHEDGRTIHVQGSIGSHETAIGNWQYYYPNGQLQMSINFKAGLLHGKATTYYLSSQIATQLHFNNSTRVDSAIYYYTNGQLKAAINYRHLANRAYFSEYDLNQLTNDAEVQLLWDWLNTYTPATTPPYVLDGKWLVYTPEGKVAYDLCYNNGVPQGNFKHYSYYLDTTVYDYVHFDEGKKNGWKYVHYYSMPRLWRKVYYADDKKQGVETTYNYTGEITKTTHYVDDMKQGVEQCYSDGVLSSTAYYKDGLLDSIYTIFDEETGRILTQTSYKQGIKWGKQYQYGKVEQNSYTNEYKYGLKQGLFRLLLLSYYYQKTNVYLHDSIHYINGYPKDWFETYQTNAGISQYFINHPSRTISNESQTQKSCFYQDSLALLQCVFKNNYISRIETYSLLDKMTTVEIYKKKGTFLKECGQLDNCQKKVGHWVKYYENGNVRKITAYENDTISGIVTTYYESGAFKTYKEYAQGAKDGDYWSYYENGNLKIKGTYEKGLKIGTWYYYAPTGILEKMTLHGVKSSLESNDSYYSKNNVKYPSSTKDYPCLRADLLPPPPPPPPPPPSIFWEEDEED